jgi:hypothetical protein
MPPKKDAADSSNLIVGFDNKECKLLAAACISMTSPDKVSWVAFANSKIKTLTIASTTTSSFPSSPVTLRDLSRRW